MIVCVLSGRLTVSAWWTRKPIVSAKGSRESRQESKGTWIAAEVRYRHLNKLKIRSKHRYLQPQAQSAACSLLGCIARPAAESHQSGAVSGKAGFDVSGQNNLWCGQLMILNDGQFVNVTSVCLARHSVSFAPLPHARNPGFVWPFQQGEVSRR